MNGIGDPYENLANAIVIQAVDDYKRALRVLQKDPHSTPAQQRAVSIERFFFSEWCSMLTKVDGGLLVKKVREVVA